MNKVTLNVVQLFCLLNSGNDNIIIIILVSIYLKSMKKFCRINTTYFIKMSSYLTRK